MSSKPLKSPGAERIARAAARILKSDGRAMASQYIYGTMEQWAKETGNRAPMQWEVLAVADRSMYLMEHPL